jgi:hypothetical protein
VHVEAHNLGHNGAQSPCSFHGIHNDNLDGVTYDLVDEKTKKKKKMIICKNNFK